MQEGGLDPHGKGRACVTELNTAHQWSAAECSAVTHQQGSREGADAAASGLTHCAVQTRPRCVNDSDFLCCTFSKCPHAAYPAGMIITTVEYSFATANSRCVSVHALFTKRKLVIMRKKGEEKNARRCSSGLLRQMTLCIISHVQTCHMGL